MPGSPSTLRILVSEAQGHVARLIRDTLLLSGHTVDLLRHGREVAGKLRGERYGLLILRQKTSGSTGLEIIEAIRDRGERVPIILMAGRSRWMQDFESHAFLEHVELLRKPFGVSELRAAVERASFQDL